MSNKVLEKYSKGFNEAQALKEAYRCLLCFDAPCEQGCPTRTPVKEFIRNIRFKNYKEAYNLIKSANIFGTSCARICNANETCKKHCTSNQLVSPIEINKLQQFVCDMFVGQEPKIVNKKKTGKKVAVIGSGPAGISAAFELNHNGVETTIFEKCEYLGGLLYDGIPSYRLPHSIVEKETKWAIDQGIKVVKGKIAPKIEILTKEFDAVIVATGFSDSNKGNLEGVNLKGVHIAKDLLKAHKLNKKIELGKKVIVVGGGNSALDSASAAIQLGATEVTLLYRRSEREMPGWEKELSVAKDLGVSIRFLTNPTKILGKEKVEGVECELLELGAIDHDGRRSISPIQNAKLTLKADSIILGIGERIDSEFFSKENIKFNSSKDDSTTLNNPKVFIAGDITTSYNSAVHAVASGRETAKALLKALSIEYSPIAKDHFFKNEEVDLSVNFCGVHFENPFLLAAAPPSDDLEMVRRAFKAGWAGAVLKTTSIESNHVPLKYPMMTGISYNDGKVMGLGNIDLISEHHVDVIEKRVRELKKEFPTKIVIASIMGEKKEDWQSLVTRLEAAGVDIIECSFSCPQGTLGSKPGFMLGQDPTLVKTVAGWVKAAAKRVPVVIKITPQVADIVEVARAVKESGADAICASNSIPSLMGIDIDTAIPYPNVNGKSTYSGFTGPAIKPITLRNIAEIKKHVDIPITGTGGPITWSDAVELMMVGATNVQFCTGVMHYGFDIIHDLMSGLTHYMKSHKIKHVNDLVGKSLKFITTHDELHQKKKIVSNINTEKCVKCGACFTACFDGGHEAILYDESTRTYRTDEKKCVGCSFCPSVCPIGSSCLSMQER